MTRTGAGFWDRRVTPFLVHGACSLDVISRQRAKIVPEAEGVVVEIGIGSGLNLPHYYPQKVKHLIGVDPNPTLVAMTDKRGKGIAFEFEVIQESAEALPLDDRIADTAVVTYALCTIPDPHTALGEVRRILKPGGRLLFCEHGRSDRARVAKWQDRITPVWKRLAGGCHLNRDVRQLIERAGFRLERLDNYSLARVPSVVGFHYLGSAHPK